MNRTTAPGSSSGLYVDGDPNIPGSGTLVIAEDKNMIQEELANAVEGAGIALNSGDDTQLSQAIKTQHIYRATETYATNDFVFYEGIPYRSLVDSNTGNQPDISPTSWEVTGGGSGGGLETLVDNSAFEADASGWTATGASIARSTSTPLVGDGSGLITWTASTGDTVDADITDMFRAYQAGWLKVQFYVENDATYVSDTVEVYLLSDATEGYIGTIPASTDIQLWTGFVLPVVGASAYKLRFKSVTGIVASSTLLIDKVIVAPADTSAQAVAPLTVTVDGNYTVEPGVDTVLVDTTSGDVTITIPAGLTVGTRLRIVKQSPDSNTVTVGSADAIPTPNILKRLSQEYTATKTTDTTWGNRIVTDSLYANSFQIGDDQFSSRNVYRSYRGYAGPYRWVKVYTFSVPSSVSSQKENVTFMIVNDGNYGTRLRNIQFVSISIRDGISGWAYVIGDQPNSVARAYAYTKEISSTEYEVWIRTGQYSILNIIPLNLEGAVYVTDFEQTTDPGGLTVVTQIGA